MAPFGPEPSATLLGLDEAGRGSLVGPLVVGGFLVASERSEDLRTMGVKDSKLLSGSSRERIFNDLGTIGSRVSVSIAPATVDRWVAAHGLNVLELRAFARLIRTMHPTAVYVDCCDPVPERFQRTLRSLGEFSGELVAAHRADREIPVVGAASIVAKVIRDRAIAELRETLGDGIGSGYPSDHRTVEFVRKTLARRAPDPKWLRRAWATTERLKLERSVVPLERFGR